MIVTTRAMIVGTWPIALGVGADTSVRQPLANAVIGGLATSMLRSLRVVPVDDVEHWDRTSATHPLGARAP